jgi:two-component system C4-dicarboxylate transport sensor histidine kinase DctB
MVEAAAMETYGALRHKGSRRWRFGIGARLGAAFVAIVGLAVGASLVG